MASKLELAYWWFKWNLSKKTQQLLVANNKSCLETYEWLEMHKDLNYNKW